MSQAQALAPRTDPLPSRFVWLAWGGALVLEIAARLPATGHDAALPLLRLAQLLWLLALLHRYDVWRLLGLTAPDAAQWRFGTAVAAGATVTGLSLWWSGLLAPWLSLPTQPDPWWT